jgi:CTP synthase
LFVLGLEGANSTEFNKETKHPVLGLISEWSDQDGSTKLRDEDSDLGGSMRLGAQICHLAEGSLIRQIYEKAEIIERHRHRYEVNHHYEEALVEGGLFISGRSVDNKLVEVIELPTHPWFIACQFHPEFTSNPRASHPLFKAFVLAARKS